MLRLRPFTAPNLCGLGYVLYGGIAIDADAAAGIAAVEAAGGTMSAGQKTAVETFILGLKSQSLWTSFMGLYLFAGGNAGGHAVNWKSPGTYTVTWVNSPTHDANGVTGNGTTSYGLCTGLIGNSVVPHLHGLTHYVRADYGAVATVRCPIGFGNNGGSLYYMAYRNNGTENAGIFGSVATSLMQDTSAFRTGTIAINRTTTSRVDIYQNGTSFISNTMLNTTTPPAVAVGLLAMNDIIGTPMFFAPANICFAAVHSPHNSTQAGALNTLVQALQASFARNV